MRALLTSWEAAQNAGDFDGYGRLYAARFTGIRRSGPRERRFDREGWMDDRRSMFAHPMQVTASDVRVTLAGGTASIEFTQSFTEGTYHDEGPKQLVVVREGSALRIAREEMLRSTLTTVPDEQQIALGALLPIVSAGTARFAVLARVPEGATWHEGDPTLVDRSDVVTTRARVHAASIPAPLAALAGQAVTTGDEAGASCAARLGELAVISRVDVHFGTEQRWDGQQDDGTTGTPATPAQIASEAWGEAMLLVAPLEGAEACTSPLYARLASMPAAPFFAASAPDAALTTAALAQFRSSESWAAIQSSLADYEITAPRWDELDGAAPTVRLWRPTTGEGHAYVVVYAQINQGCAGFQGSDAHLYEVGDGNALREVDPPALPHLFVPRGAADIDGDGVPEWRVDDGIARRLGNALVLVVDTQYVSYDCDC